MSPSGRSIVGVLALAAVLAGGWRVAEHFPRAPRRAELAILRRGNQSEPESLDPQRARSEAALTILRDAYEGLTSVGADGLPVLAAADRSEVSADGKTYRLHLRPTARWSNGDAVVAEDFAAAWRRLLDPHTGAQYAEIFNVVVGAREIIAGRAAPSTLAVQAPDEATLVIDLVRPTSYFLAILAHPAAFPLHRPTLQAKGTGFAKPGVMVTNGAFVPTRWDFGSHLVAARNAYYWNVRQTQWDRIEYYSFADAATELRAYRAGELDVTSTVPAAQTPWIKTHFGPQLRLAPQLAVYYLGLNLRLAPFDQAPLLRQALSMVIDRERLVQSVTGSGELPAYTLVPPQTAAYAPPQPDYAAWPLSRRIERARVLLREAGFAAHPPALELRYNTNELHARIAVAVAQMWKQALGIEVTLRAEEFKVLLQDIDRGNVVQIFRASWIADYDDAFSFLQILQSGFGINLPHYANPAYDALLAQAADASMPADATRRASILQRAEALMLRDQPLIPLYFYVSKHLVASGIRGWQDNPMNVVYSKNLRKALSAAARLDDSAAP